ncbi:MAG: asparagine synthase (glutamine-hydrolyzing) [Desulfobacterales bacterium]|nr:asparagine synthase (glutamine-hydrolyzing) [Desulfobacterales bacterium]
MCGITGLYNMDSTQYGIDKTILESMTDQLIHRGPDDSGYYSDQRIGFGFRRLSIIDLNTGNQPMFNEDHTIVSVCNGEIYNYKELKERLIAKGHIFYTVCDVEVLVHLFEEYGTHFVNELNGQFAFAIYDKKTGSLMLARDHVGIAPMFYTSIHHVFIFASEIKAILNHPLVKPEVNLTALDQIFSFPGMISPETMFTNIWSLKPGHYLRIQHTHTELIEYWDLNYPEASQIDHGKPESYYIDQLDDLLMKSVNYRLHADVPVGFYLSGGLDSSLIAAMIHKIHPEKRHSFSIGFTDKDIDERTFQQLMIKQVMSEHHESVFDQQDILDRLKQVIYHAESPLKESYDTCSLTLSQLVKKNNIKVVLTGEGSDELFAGYVGYRFDEQRSYQDDLDISMMIEREIREKLWGDPNFLYEKNQFEFRETKQAMYSDAVNEKFSLFDCVNKEPVNKQRLTNRHPFHKRSYLDFKLRLSEHLLADHGDRVAYANSVEARYPFLDIRLIEFIQIIPPHLLIHNAVEKYILKKMASRYLPTQIIQREKFAFVAQGSPYLIRQKIEWIEDMLSYETIKRQGYFNPNTIERLKKIYRDDMFMLNQTFENDLLLIVLTFGIFLEIFNIRCFM